MGRNRWRVGVDVGGTFTDVAVLDRQTSRVEILKVPTTPADPSIGVLNGMSRAQEVVEGFDIADVADFLHGTTITTNALIQRTFRPCALLVTEGMRGSVSVQDQRRVGNTYDLRSGHPDSLVADDHVFEVPERIGADAKVVRDLDRGAVVSIARRLRELDVRSVAVCLIFSFANPVHEQQVREILATELPGARVSLSSEVLPRIREWPRISTMLLGASLEPLLIDYITSLATGLTGRGLAYDRLFLMESNGGLMPFSAVMAGGRAVHTLLSGPAAGVQAAISIARSAGRRDLLTVDVGGTSADIAFVRHGEALEVTEGELVGHQIYVPMLDLMTIGAGGGTLSQATTTGRLLVGPNSAGADPGPACYGRGGQIPTTTDADLALGLLDPEYYLGGQMTVRQSLAVEAITRHIAEPLGISPQDAAEATLQLNEVHMADAIKVFAAKRGVDLGDATLVACGGAGSLHACGVATELGVRQVLVPPFPGAFSAVGLLTTDVIQDFVQTDITKLREGAGPAILTQFAALEQRAVASLSEQGFDRAEIVCHRELDARYSGQGFELRLQLADVADHDDLPAGLADLFHTEHARIYGHAAHAELVEVVSYRIRAVVAMPTYTMTPLPPEAIADEAPRPPRRVYHRGGWIDAAVVRRAALAPGSRLPGPVLIEQPDTTAFAPPGWTVRIDAYGNLLLSNEGTQ
ncbi:hydantoinase/oxoprolinase family protein [Rugosimonospora africana]|uniref:Methylhydantoinase n=1 Tax=Rugosimonospora africana TaxID=556532 RepID=A0A8J3R042_9ACTN|nr:hydantoinase/oxoprolinase family protein [Rugosimonospora africana]GIH17781.1 methylhydantoinase [Rugosimonospora africana]